MKAFLDTEKQLSDISARKEENFAANSSIKADIEKKKIELEKWKKHFSQDCIICSLDFETEIILLGYCMNHIRTRKSFPQAQAAREKVVDLAIYCLNCRTFVLSHILIAVFSLITVDCLKN